MLDFDTCNSARLNHDAAYDGMFFVGVRTTRIYCRPICRAGPAHSRNVSFFPTAAAAENAGYRPCLRCRPESAPFCPAWQGTKSTVARALRLIAQGALDDDSVEMLAARLGVGSRHLSRLFDEHLKASPTQVARTQRVARAKRLLDRADQPLDEIARLAGFGSTRRMRTSFHAVYGRSPTDLQKRNRPEQKRGSRDATFASWQSNAISSDARQGQTCRSVQRLGRR